jgi:threonine/homoserine/homoserine lactone efflux protein
MRTRIALAVCGTAVMAFAVAGALTDPDLDVAGALVFLGASLVVHDVLWMPAVLLAGVLLTRLVIRRRAAVQAVAIVGLVLAIVALPLLLGGLRT